MYIYTITCMRNNQLDFNKVYRQLIKNVAFDSNKGCSDAFITFFVEATLKYAIFFSLTDI